MSLPDGREQHVVYTSDQHGGYKTSMEYMDNLSRVDQAMEGDNTYGSYQVKLLIVFTLNTQNIFYCDHFYLLILNTVCHIDQL